MLASDTVSTSARRESSIGLYAQVIAIFMQSRFISHDGILFLPSYVACNEKGDST